MENTMKNIRRTRGDRVFDAINVFLLCILLIVNKICAKLQGTSLL